MRSAITREATVNGRGATVFVTGDNGKCDAGIVFAHKGDDDLRIGGYVFGSKAPLSSVVVQSSCPWTHTVNAAPGSAEIMKTRHPSIYWCSGLAIIAAVVVF